VGDYNAFLGKKWKDIFNLSFFYDSTKGWINDPLSFQEDTTSLEGYGFSVQLKETNGFSGRFYMAKPMGNPEPSNDRDPQYYFEFSYNF
jgi:hemolysin activation/secretion protein